MKYNYSMLISVACAQFGIPGVLVPAIFDSSNGGTTPIPIPATEQPIGGVPDQQPAPSPNGTPVKTEIPIASKGSSADQIIPAVEQPINPPENQPTNGGNPSDKNGATDPTKTTKTNETTTESISVQITSSTANPANTAPPRRMPKCVIKKTA